MARVNTIIQKRQKILSTYFRELAAKKNNALGSSGGYIAVIDTEQNHFVLLRTGWSEG